MFRAKSIGAPSLSGKLPTGDSRVENVDIELLLTATVIKNDLVSMVLGATGDFAMLASAAGGLGRVYGVALEAGVSGDVAAVRVKGVADINCEGKNGAGAGAAIGQGTGIVMEASATTSTGRAAVAGDSCCGVTGLAQSVASGAASTSLKCYFDGVGFLGTET